jgi:hypothetical protein
MEPYYGTHPDCRRISAAIWRRRRILWSQTRVLVIGHVPALKREQGLSSSNGEFSHDSPTKDVIGTLSPFFLLSARYLERQDSTI